MSLDINTLKVGDSLPERKHTATNVSLFMYNAAVWNHHRIHYDERYTIEEESHPAVVIDGPLQGDWLSQVALNWVGDTGRLLSFNYSNRRAAYLGDTLTSGGRIVEIDKETGQVQLELFIRNGDGNIITPGQGLVEIDRQEAD
ncbi:MAG: hypothetical protein AAF513_05510 [Pseudomonadota bacterium]